MVPLRRLASMTYGDALSTESREAGPVPVMSSGGRTGWHSKANTRAPVIVVGRKGSHGSLWWSDEPAFVIDTAYSVDASNTEANLRWLYYVLQTLNLSSLSNDVGVPGLSRAAAYERRVADIEPAEQQRIADFLDDRVGRIDRIVAARQQQRRLAREAYEAWLDTACAELRDRCGETPLRRLKLVIEQGWSPQVDAAAAQPGEPGLLKLGAVRRGEFYSDQNKAFPESMTPREEYRIERGDLLITRANTPALVGDVAVVDEVGECPLYLSDLIYRVKTERADSHFISTCLRTSAARQEIAVIARGTSGSMPKLRGEDLRGLSVPNASLPEQRALGLADQRQRLDLTSTTAALTRSIDLLTEYKQSLITAAVTGQLDVTTASTRIPE